MAVIGKNKERVQEDSGPVNEILSGFFPDSYLKWSQIHSDNGLVEKMNGVPRREKFNLSLPRELMAELNRIAERYGPKRKGLVFAAAALRLIELTEKEQDRYVQLVGSAELTGDFSGLVSDAQRRSSGRRFIFKGEMGKLAPPPDPDDRPAGPKPKRKSPDGRR